MTGSRTRGNVVGSMGKSAAAAQSTIPSVDKTLRTSAFTALVDRFGRQATTDALRGELARVRENLRSDDGSPELGPDELAARVESVLAGAAAASLRPVFNLTGTVLHTNLGRALLAPEAVEAIAAAASEPSNLEYDLEEGKRGERDSHLEGWLTRLTGAEAATVVNNNAAALLIVLNTFALRKEVPVSRGELIEIGGSFRLPEIMSRAGCRLHEVGTTNRTHLSDYANAVSSRTGLVLKVHMSNYTIHGFTAAVPEKELAALSRERGVPFVVDLGSGTLANLERYGLHHEPTPAESIQAGADLVTFSGDKLLGGPQAGIIVGRKALVDRIRRNPLKRALRLDKMTIAALGATLNLYADPDRLGERLPTLALLSRPAQEIEAMASRLLPRLTNYFAVTRGSAVTIDVAPCHSQIGSGALPVYTIPSFALRIQPASRWRGAGRLLNQIAAELRRLPTPVIGRVVRGALWLDLRCLRDESAFADLFSRPSPMTETAE